jgi:cytochrome c
MKGARGRRCSAVVAALFVCFSLASAGRGEEDAERLNRGKAIVTKNCAPCHAVEREGKSRHSEAPPFRLIGRRYPVESLEEALGEGIISGHPDMPEFVFSGEDVGAIIGYLKSIQE